jgi:hypothetical protein
MTSKHERDRNIYNSARFITPNEAYHIVKNLKISDHAYDRLKDRSNSIEIQYETFSMRKVISYDYLDRRNNIIKSYIFPYKDAIASIFDIILDESLLMNKYGIVQIINNQFTLITIIQGPSKYIHLIESILERSYSAISNEWYVIEGYEFMLGKEYSNKSK